MQPKDTIFALSTGPQASAIAVIRLSGPAAVPTAEALAGRKLEARRAQRVWLRRPDGERLDDGIAIVFPGPASFTGEDCAELHVHGGRAVVRSLLEALSGAGLRPAEPGEFTRRAFFNGKLDLVEVEGLADLLVAQTEGQRKQALAQLEGLASGVYEAWRQRLVRVLAHVEALIDFSDEAHVAEALPAPLRQEITALAGEMRAALARARQGERMRDGFRLVLAGPPNAGKSSLFNELVRRDAAIVSDVAGTTRDVLEALVEIAGWPVLLADTAGLRPEAADAIEAEGMRRSRNLLAGADIVLWLAAPDAPAEPPEMDSEPIYIWNKADLLPPPADKHGWIALSVTEGRGLADLQAEITRRLSGLAGKPGEDALVTRERHRQALSATLAHLEMAENGWDGAFELVSEALRLASRELGRLVGRVDVEDLLNVIFTDFCIGK